MIYIWKSQKQRDKIKMHIQAHNAIGDFNGALCGTKLAFSRSINAPFALGRPVCKHCLTKANELRA